MDSPKEQRIAVKCCVKLGKFATEIFPMLNTAHGDVVMKSTAYFKWHGRFKGGRQSIEDDERHGIPQRQLTTNTLTKSTPWCAQIDV